MTPTDLLNELTRRGVIFELKGERLRYKAPMGVLTPELKRALAAQKTMLVQLLAADAAAPAASNALDDRAIVAVEVWSGILGEAIWVVANDLPKEAWPGDALAYTHQEVKVLQQLGQDTLAWVHATKQMFGALVIPGRGRPLSHPETTEPDMDLLEA
jgi:hypothetical protein